MGLGMTGSQRTVLGSFGRDKSFPLRYRILIESWRKQGGCRGQRRGNREATGVDLWNGSNVNIGTRGLGALGGFGVVRVFVMVVMGMMVVVVVVVMVVVVGMTTSNS